MSFERGEICGCCRNQHEGLMVNDQEHFYNGGGGRDIFAQVLLSCVMFERYVSCMWVWMYASMDLWKKEKNPMKQQDTKTKVCRPRGFQLYTFHLTLYTEDQGKEKGRGKTGSILGKNKIAMTDFTCRHPSGYRKQPFLISITSVGHYHRFLVDNDRTPVEREEEQKKSWDWK